MSVKFTYAPEAVDTHVDWSKGVLDPNSEADQNTGSFTSESRVNFYSDNAKFYDEDMKRFSFRGPLEAAEAAHRVLTPNYSSYIIDVGGGTGKVVQEMRKLGHYNNVDGLDAAKGMLDIAAKKGLYKNIIHQYFSLDSGIEHNTYDAAVCAGAFVAGHLKSDAMIELCNIVKPGGYVIVTMRHEHLSTVDEFRTHMRPTIEKLISDRRWEPVEDRTFPKWCFGDSGCQLDGHLFIYKKL